jgi:hypothetical protein
LVGCLCDGLRVGGAEVFVGSQECAVEVDGDEFDAPGAGPGVRGIGVVGGGCWNRVIGVGGCHNRIVLLAFRESRTRIAALPPHRYPKLARL